MAKFCTKAGTMRRLTFGIIFLTIVSLLGVVPSLAEEIVGKPRIIDGDTIELGGKRIRLYGIDAPESKQTCVLDGKPWNCGQEATWALAYVLAEHWVTCRQTDIDRYNRIVAVCFVGGDHNINEYMVRNGWALAYRQYSMDYVSSEADAQREKIGLWKGKFEKPWDWRRKGR